MEKIFLYPHAINIIAQPYFISVVFNAVERLQIKLFSVTLLHIMALNGSPTFLLLFLEINQRKKWLYVFLK